MRRGTKFIVIVVLVGIIAAAAAYIFKMFDLGGPKPPQWVLDQPVEKIDMNTLELMTLPLGEWQHLGKKGMKYKNPNTGEYTMVLPFVCASCGEKIPHLEGDATLKMWDEYVCPKCGGPATGPPGPLH